MAEDLDQRGEAADMTISELKDQLRSYGALLGGLKQDLVERLEPLLVADREHLSDMVYSERSTPLRFWRIAVIADYTVMQFGRVDHKGTTLKRQHNSNEDALQFAEKQVKDKLKKGFALVTKKKRKAGAAAPAAPVATPTATTKRARTTATSAAAAAAAATPATGGAAAGPAVGAAAAAAAAVGGPKGAKPGAPDATTPLGTVDPIAALPGTATVYNAGGEVYDCMLNQLDLAKNHDKYYIAQVIKDGDNYYCLTHWGRTGLAGQFKLDGPFDDAQPAIDIFEEKFKEKTGNDWSDKLNFVAHSGKYDLLKTDYAAKASKSHATWQYYMNAPQDGKSVGWYDYDASASDIVEDLHDTWLANQQLSVRIVSSGTWTYRVDLTTMEQTNISTQKQRPIRRMPKAGSS